MYGALWRRLPGPWPIKFIESAALLGGLVALLFIVVFPWIEPRLPFTDVTVDDQQEGSDTVDTNNPTAPATSDSPVLGAGSPDYSVTSLRVTA